MHVICVCMYVCIYIYTCLPTYIRIYMYKCIHLCVHTCAPMYVYQYTYLNLYIHIAFKHTDTCAHHNYICMCVICVFMSIHRDVFPWTSAYIHVYIYAYIFIDKCFLCIYVLCVCPYILYTCLIHSYIYAYIHMWRTTYILVGAHTFMVSTHVCPQNTPYTPNTPHTKSTSSPTAVPSW